MITTELTSQQTHDCPACNGIMPADAVVVEEWRLVHVDEGYFRSRDIYMQCPHCGYFESRTERRQVFDCSMMSQRYSSALPPCNCGAG